jgi:membrane protease YdiL (CAAX protease family)
VIIIVLLWIAATAGRFWLTVAFGSNPGREEAPQGVKIVNRFLYFDLFRDEAGVLGQQFIDGLMTAAQANFRDGLAEAPPDRSRVLPFSAFLGGPAAVMMAGAASQDSIFKYAVLMGSMGQEKEAASLLERSRFQIGNGELLEIIERLYTRGDKKARKVPPGEVASIEKTVRSGLTDWFRDRTLMELYRQAGDKAREQALMGEARKSLASLSVGLGAVILVLGAGLFIGPIILLALILSSIFVFKKSSLSSRGISREDSPSFSPVSLKDAIIVFVSWDFARTGVGIFLGIAYGVRGHSPPQAVFFSHILLYAFILFLIGWAILKKNGAPDLSGLGFPREGLAAGFLQVLLGIGSYLSVVPVMMGGVLLYQAIFKESTRSSNPAFDIISGVTDSLGLFMIFSLVGIFGPIFEEILFRGYLYTAVRKYMPAYGAAPLVGFVFALIHFDPGVLFPLFLLGTLLAVIYERSGSLIPAIITHGIWNSMTFIMFYTLLK